MSSVNWVLAAAAAVWLCLVPSNGRAAELEIDGVLEWDRNGSMVYSVAFSPHDKTLAVSSGDRCLRLWDTSNWKPRVLERPTHQRQLEVVDERRAVARQVRDEAALDQVDQVAGKAQLDWMAAKEQDDGRGCPRSGEVSSRQARHFGNLAPMGQAGRQARFPAQVVPPLTKRQQRHGRAVEWRTECHALPPSGELKMTANLRLKPRGIFRGRWLRGTADQEAENGVVQAHSRQVRRPLAGEQTPSAEKASSCGGTEPTQRNSKRGQDLLVAVVRDSVAVEEFRQRPVLQPEHGQDKVFCGDVVAPQQGGFGGSGSGQFGE